MAEDFIALGIQAAQNGDRQRAVSLLSQAVRQTPDSAQAWHWLGRVLDDPEKKKFCFERAARLDPGRNAAVNAPPAVPPAASPAAAVPPFSQNVPPPPKIKEPPVRQAAPAPDNAPRNQWSVWMILGLCGLLACTAVVFVLLLLTANGTLAIGNPPAAPAGTLPPTTTLMVWSTSTPTLTETATPIPSATPTHTLTPTRNATQNFAQFSLQITAVKQAYTSSQYDACVQGSDRLLTEMPDWADGYFYRSLCRYDLAYDLNSQSQYKEYLLTALDDSNTAISLDPTQGDYYVLRGLVYFDLTNTTSRRVDQRPFVELAAENLKAGLAMGYSIFVNVDMIYASTLMNLERCVEGEVVINRVLAAMPANEKPSASLLNRLSDLYICQGQYAKALPVIQKSLQTQFTCSGYIDETTTLLGLGNPDKALSEISICIKQVPNYSGFRFYQRALIYYDKGQKDQARQDLMMGMGNTWDRGGLFNYLMARFALDDGDRGEAISWLQEAEACIEPWEGPWLKDRIRRELAALKTAPMTPTAQIKLDATPLPAKLFTPQPTRTSTQTNTPIPGKTTPTVAKTK